MRVLMVHNHYRERGGEDYVFAAESGLLRRHGHRVLQHTVDNRETRRFGGPFALAAATVWNRRVYRDLRALIRQERPDVVHFHNTFPLISPAAHHAVKAEGLPVVQTLHNWRLLCPGGFCLRGTSYCEDCLDRLVAWPGVRHRCYRRSGPATLAVALMLAAHRALKTWSTKVDVFVALTESCRDMFVRAGLPREKITIKPNFLVADPGTGNCSGEYALFAGRLSPEKGVSTLLDAWPQIEGGIRLKIAGDGPLAERVVKASGLNRDVEWLGRLPSGKVCDVIGDARLLVFPSLGHEGLPLTLIQAFAKGTPVIASDRGPLRDIVDCGNTGLRFPAGDAAELARLVDQVYADRSLLSRLRETSRAEFLAKYTPEKNYQRLIQIYSRAVGQGSDSSQPSHELSSVKRFFGQQ